MRCRERPASGPPTSQAARSGPTGLFRADAAEFSEITASSAEHISGQFSFTGTGFLTSDPSDEDSEVTVKGAFTSTHSVPAALPAQP